MVVRTPNMSTKLLLKAYEWANSAHFSLLPGVCVNCKCLSGRRFDLCTDCEQLLATITRPCPSCALPLPPETNPALPCGSCLLHHSPIDRIEAPFAWAEPVSSLVSGFKYEGHLQQGRVLATLLANHLRARYSASALPALLVPVPLHPARLRQRGFNQSVLLARQLGQQLCIPVAADLVSRIARTPPQQGLGAAERKRNLRNAFRVERPQLLRNCHSLALIDDVVTTMSTVQELAEVVCRHGAADMGLHVWALARA